jgi:cyclohexyl-isocyanide hydratase
MDPLQIAMVLYPGFTLLDLAGPEAVLGLHGQVHLVAGARGPVPTDNGARLEANLTFAEAPERFDVLFVPGGLGTNRAMADVALLRFLATRGAVATWVTSVCSGSLLLAAAGLLRGYRAATHWLACDALAALGAEVSRERVVVDRNRVTGGGVTAGIDFGLVLLARLRGEEAAKTTQLAMEYDPQPPFKAGTPEAAGPAITELARTVMAASGALDIDLDELNRAQQAAGIAAQEAAVLPRN